MANVRTRRSKYSGARTRLAGPPRSTSVLEKKVFAAVMKIDVQKNGELDDDSAAPK